MNKFERAYIVRYIASDALKWRYFKKFRFNRSVDKIKVVNFNYMDEAEIFEMQEAEEVVQKIKKLYDEAPKGFFIKEMQIIDIEKNEIVWYEFTQRIPISRFDLMELK
jgi:hypothetical protein